MAVLPTAALLWPPLVMGPANELAPLPISAPMPPVPVPMIVTGSRLEYATLANCRVPPAVTVVPADFLAERQVEMKASIDLGMTLVPLHWQLWEPGPYGLGAMMPAVQGVSYIAFLAGGMVVSSTMYAATSPSCVLRRLCARSAVTVSESGRSQGDCRP